MSLPISLAGGEYLVLSVECVSINNESRIVWDFDSAPMLDEFLPPYGLNFFHFHQINSAIHSSSAAVVGMIISRRRAQPSSDLLFLLFDSVGLFPPPSSVGVVEILALLIFHDVILTK